MVYHPRSVKLVTEEPQNTQQWWMKIGNHQDSRLLYFLPETLVTVKGEGSSKTKNVASEEPPKKKI